jgi:hypothetical protein
MLTAEDVLVLLVDVGKDLRRQTEVLCNDRLRGVFDPLVQQERRVFREIAIVEDKEKLSAVLTQTLQ